MEHDEIEESNWNIRLDIDRMSTYEKFVGADAFDLTTEQQSDNKTKDIKALKEAAEMLQAGELVAFPTETVYGLGADATNKTAVQAIFKAKGRPQDNPLIVHVATIEQLYTYTMDQPAYVEQLLHAFTPGPLTLVLPDRGLCAEEVTAGLSTIAIRIPNHKITQDLIRFANLPLAAPSANISGKPSPTTADHVFDDLNGRIAGIVDGGQTGVGLESTVIDCTSDIPVILRPGGITKEMIENELGISLQADTVSLNKTDKPKAPGMKYKHYAPEIPLWLVHGSLEEFNRIIEEEYTKGKRVAVLSDHSRFNSVHGVSYYDLGQTFAEIGAEVYNGLRYFKEGKYDVIICQAFEEVGMGSAIMNRLKKAATLEI